MPLFRRRVDTGQRIPSATSSTPVAAFNRSGVDVAESTASIEGGGLPLAAQRRLASLASSEDSLFTSDLSVSEFVSIKRHGLVPISQIMGSSVYRVGFQTLPIGWSGVLATLTDAYNNARSLAISRLSQEASLCGADAVVGVHITLGSFDFMSDMVEFSALGTAVRSPQLSLSLVSASGEKSAALTSLSGQELAQLLDNGYKPCGLVGASSVYLASLGTLTYQQVNSRYMGAGANFEIVELTDGIYRNRHLVTSELEAQARRVGAEGIIGVNWTQSSRNYSYPSQGEESLGAVAFTNHALATAIRHPSTSNDHASKLSPVVMMRS